MVERSAIQQIGDGSIPIPSLQVRLIDHKVAKPFIEKWHYSRKVPTGKNIYFGWFVNGVLYAVADYGHGANMNEKWADFLNKSAGLPSGNIKNHKNGNLLELKRLCRTEPRLEYPLTKFLAICHKMLKRDFSVFGLSQSVRFIISFSDPQWSAFKNIIKDKKGNKRVYDSGGLYAAANFKFLGKTNEEMHVKDSQGNIVHRRVAYKEMWRENLRRCVENGVSEKELRAGWKDSKNRKKWSSWAKTLPQVRKELGYTPCKTPTKDRWILDLGEENER